MEWRIVVFFGCALGFCAALWFFGTAFYRHLATTWLARAMAAARARRMVEAKRWIDGALGLHSPWRQCAALHEFYATIQAEPAASDAELAARIAALTAAVAQRKQNFADRLWARPRFAAAMGGLLVAILLMVAAIRFCTALAH